MARLRKLRPAPVAIAITLYDVWRRLPPRQRKQVLKLARKHGPKAAAKLFEVRNTLRRRP